MQNLPCCSTLVIIVIEVARAADKFFSLNNLVFTLVISNILKSGGNKTYTISLKKSVEGIGTKVGESWSGNNTLEYHPIYYSCKSFFLLHVDMSESRLTKK